ncbi:MMPL family transporter [Millisia brevis]|uniref:MMPL family transporter n=1 Tax=Millisia brevis TaxID=264148 RepID=UPI000835BCA2|nr:MMPL family transporter [Millisia brevis]
MARLLQRLGLAAAHRRGLVVVIWLLALIAAGAGAATLSGPTATSFSIPGTESTEALDTVNSAFPDLRADGATAQVVIVAPDGTTVQDPAVAAPIAQAVQALSAVPEVHSVTDPLNPAQPSVSPDLRVALSTVTFDVATGNVSEESLHDVQEAVDAARAAGLDVRIGGNAYETTPEILGPGEIVGVAVAFIVLMLTYGSLAAAGANLATALIGVGIGAAGVTALTGFIDLQSTTPILAVMLGLAVGIDYALFIFARFRSELRRGREVHEAIGRATGTAGSAVTIAGTTVVIALAGLSVVGIPFLAEMGLAAAATVVIAVLVAITLVPAILSYVGMRALRASERVTAIETRGSGTIIEEAVPNGRGFLRGWSSVITDRPFLSAVAGLVVIGVLAVPMASMTTSLPNDGDLPTTSERRQTYDLVTDNFGAGANGPLLMLVQGQDPATSAAAVAATVQQESDVVAVTPPIPSSDGSAALFTVIPGSGPTDEATADLVHRLRATDFGSGVEVKITGPTAVGIDVDETLSGALPRYLALVVGLALLLLLVVFRSILVPVIATVGFLASYGAALGVTVAVFQWGWLGGIFGVDQPAPLMSLLPIIVVGILFGLAMDYQVFLVSRIHEAYAHGEDPKEAVRHGFRRSAPVVVAAATIMASVFGGFVTSGESMIASIALALTVGVLVDAFLVRMVIIPAVLSLLGRSAWWMPSGLDRILPDLDVEGRAIEAQDRPADDADLVRSAGH